MCLMAGWKQAVDVARAYVAASARPETEPLDTSTGPFPASWPAVARSGVFTRTDADPDASDLFPSVSVFATGETVRDLDDWDGPPARDSEMTVIGRRAEDY